MAAAVTAVILMGEITNGAPSGHADAVSSIQCPNTMCNQGEVEHGLDGGRLSSTTTTAMSVSLTAGS